MEANFPSTEDLTVHSMKTTLGKPKDSAIETRMLTQEIRDRIISKGHLKEGEDAGNLHLSFERVMTEELELYDNLEESPTLRHIRKLLPR